MAEVLRSSILEALSQHPSVPEEVRDYVVDTASGLVDDIQQLDANSIAAELLDAIAPLLEGSIPESTISELCTKVARAFKGIGENEAGGPETAEGAADSNADYVVKCEGIILAYAGKSLLRSTSLHLKRGRCYGIVGHNGVGKTTLLTRIAAGDIAGFPQDIRCVYVQHEILANDEQNVLDYMKAAQARLDDEQADVDVGAVLGQMGFTEALQSKTVMELSGGWRMRLALAGAILRGADLLLLDEPTNHLDVDAVAWLVQYLGGLERTTVLIVSHDYKFLSAASTDVIHFADLSLHYYDAGWPQFAAARPDVMAALPSRKANSYFAEMTGYVEPLIRFPDPGTLDGVKSRLKPIMKLTNVTFRYDASDRDVLKSVNVRMSLSSRVALIGPNGAGKTTLLKLLVGDLEKGTSGEVWKHHNLRVAYIAQHSMHHLEENLSKSPITYIQDRFFQGRDRELSKMVTMALTEEEEAVRQKRNNVSEIVGRATRGGELCYEVRRAGRRDTEVSWEPLSNLRCKEPYVMKLVKNFDEKMKTFASGLDVRPIHETEVRQHLADYGIEGDLAGGKIKRFSAGQKCRVVLAAAMWNRPHVLALDEPTNYIDKETLKALVRALKAFKGAVLTISHNAEFVAEVANEKWLLDAGMVRALPREDAPGTADSEARADADED